MKNVKRMVRIGAYAAVSLVAMGCTKTVTIPASEIPALAEGLYGQGNDFPTVRTVDGDIETIVPTNHSIQIQMGSKVDTIVGRFAAQIVDENLVVSKKIAGRRQHRAYPLANHPTGTLELDNRQGVRKIRGGILVGFGAAALAGSVAMFAVAEESLDKEAYTFGFMGLILGAGTLGLAIPGIVLLTKEPTKPFRFGQTEIVPTLQLGPEGANLSVAF